MDSETSFISADFSSFEDLSARIILLPRRDDECTGAKVGSHEVPTEITTDEGAPTEETCLPVEEVGGSMSMDDIELDDPTKPDDTAVKENSSRSEQPDPDANSEEIEDLEKPAQAQKGQQNVMQVPLGYVLVEIRNLNDSDTNGMPEDLESIEFSDLLSVLREASFPLSLVFAPPTDTPTSQGSFFADNENAECNKERSARTSSTDSDSEELSDDDDFVRTETNETAQSLPIATLVSREDATQYAKQAATELRGRLSGWGYYAATRAADAASQVKELRDERQRKINDEQQSRDDQNEDGECEFRLEADDDTAQPQDLPVGATASDKTQPQDLPMKATHIPLDAASGGKKYADPMEPCFIFLQTPSGFEQITDDNPPITNNSVVSVRLSKERACPLGKKGGCTFQWYRSIAEGEIIKESSMPSEDDESNRESRNWSLLRGACYAAYQPNVSDAAHRLRCIIKHGTDGNISHQACHLPCLVTIDPSLFESVKMTLLGGKKTVRFGNLRKMDDLTIFRLKIDVKSSEDFITSSSIFIDKMTGVSAGESPDEMEPVSHFKAVADPAKPRLFDLICSSHGRLRLDAANRKSRESLLLALGIANFKGKLSTLTTETNLFPSCETEAEPHAENDSTPMGSIDVSKLQPDAISAESPDNMHSKQLEAMHRLLESKDIAITKFQQELVTVEKKLASCRGSERRSKDALERCETKLEEKVRTIEGLNKAQCDAGVVQGRTVKALKNEKQVFQAAIEARDGKIEGLKNQVSELEKKSSLQSEQLSSIESLKSNLVQSQEKCSTAERIITEMKEMENELQKDLKSAQGIVINLNDKFLAAKETASKRESECRKFKMERNSLKNRAEGLSKEMLRMRALESEKLKTVIRQEALETEKLKTVIQRLTRENGDLQEQVEVVKSEKRDALGKLEATCLAHQQSVSSYQLSTDGNSGACVSEQHIDELENVISSMTEYLNAKEMQIETLKQVNRALTEDMSKLTQP